MAGIMGDPQQVFPQAMVGIPKNRIWQRLIFGFLGMVLFFPGLVVLVLTRILPSLHLVEISFQEYDSATQILRFVGMRNYQVLSELPVFQETFNFAFVLICLRIIVVIIPPLILALGAAGLGRKIRKWLGVVFVLPWMLYSPLALGITWLVLLNPNFGVMSRYLSMTDPLQAPWIVLLVDGISVLGLSLGVSFTAFLAVLKGAGKGYHKKYAVGAFLILSAVLVMGAAAFSVQWFGPIHVFNLAGFRKPFYTCMVFIYDHVYQLAKPGLGIAAASLVLFVVMLCGALSSLLMLFSNLRLLSLPHDSTPMYMADWMKILFLFLLPLPVAGLVISVLPGLLKWISLLGPGAGGLVNGMQQILSGLDFAQHLLNTWVGPLAFVLFLQLPITLLTALSIGVFRPLGRFSDSLLLLFSPWLFVTNSVLSPALHSTLSLFHLESSFLRWGFPHLLNIPLLFILTLFFKGQRINLTIHDDSVNILNVYILPSLPWIGIGLLGGLLTIQQELFWPLSLGLEPGNQNLALLFDGLLRNPALSWQGISGLFFLFRVPASLLLLLILGFFQLRIAPKLGIRTGKIIR